MNVNENQKSYILDENFIFSISQSDHVKNRLFLHKKSMRELWQFLLCNELCFHSVETNRLSRFMYYILEMLLCIDYAIKEQHFASCGDCLGLINDLTQKINTKFRIRRWYRLSWKLTVYFDIFSFQFQE